MAGTEEYDLHLKILMLGDTGVGKTCLLVRYESDSYHPLYITTIGIDYKIKFLDVDGTKIRLQIWDTAGQERFRTITVSYFKGAHGIMLVYDITDRESFDNITHWINQIKEHADSSVNIVLVANKCDARKAAGLPEEGQALADHYSVSFFETSAKENMNVNEAYFQIARETKDKVLAKEESAPKAENIILDNHSGSRKSRKKCC
ncbi:unnamed protein product [Heterosigma akashiwo]